MTTLAEAIAKNLRRIRTSKGLSSTKLAEKSKTSRQTVDSYEHSRKGISVETITRFAKALEVEETELTSDPELSEFRILADRTLDAATQAAYRSGLEEGRRSSPFPPEITRLLGLIKNSQFQNLKDALEAIVGAGNHPEEAVPAQRPGRRRD